MTLQLTTAGESHGPALVAIIWNGLFGRLAPLDIRELMRAHLQLLFGKRSAT